MFCSSYYCTAPKLLRPNWMSAKFNRFGSYSALIPDLNVAAEAALEQSPTDYANIAGLGIARQTAREMLLNMPVSILIAWLRLGHVKRVMTLVDALNIESGSGQTTELVIEISNELLAMKQADQEGTSHFDLAQDAYRLLKRAIEMLQFVSFSVFQQHN